MSEYAFTDSSFLVARFNVRDRDHRAAIKFLEDQKGAGPDAFRLVFSDYVFDETVTALVARAKRHELASAAGHAMLESKNLRLVRVESPSRRLGSSSSDDRTNGGRSRTVLPSSSWRTWAFARPLPSTRTFVRRDSLRFPNRGPSVRSGVRIEREPAVRTEKRKKGDRPGAVHEASATSPNPPAMPSRWAP